MVAIAPNIAQKILWTWALALRCTIMEVLKVFWIKIKQKQKSFAKLFSNSQKWACSTKWLKYDALEMKV